MTIRAVFPMKQDPPIVIADISAYNADRRNLDNIKHFDFDKYYQRGGRVIIMRATVGTAGRDYEYEYNLNRCKELGIHVILYHYAKVWKNLDKQAKLFANAIADALDTGMLLDAFLDIEANDGLSKNAFTNAYAKLMIKTELLAGMVLGIYTRAMFWNHNTYRTDLPKRCKLWVAHYFSIMDEKHVPRVRPYIPDDWGAIHNPRPPFFWQYTDDSDGYLWGSTGDDDIDLNYFTWNGGTYDAFKKLYGVDIKPDAIQPPPPPPPPPNPTRVVVRSRVGVVIREEPSIKSSYMGAYRYGTILDVNDTAHTTGDVTIWYQLCTGYWVAGNYKGIDLVR